MPESIASEIVEHYNKTVDDPLSVAFREGSFFFNYGYWHKGATSVGEASECLMAELVENTIIAEGANVLDVACGMGATTEYITKNTRAASVVGINISRRQLDVCRARVPGIKFFEMSATDLRFGSEAFDNIFCVEAAFHFETRFDFFVEARRVLKPGGHLTMTDIPNPLGGPGQSTDNWVDSIDDYGELLKDAGFTPVRLVDRHKECVEGIVPFILFFRDTMLQRGEISWGQYRWLTNRADRIARYSYLEVVAEAT